MDDSVISASLYFMEALGFWRREWQPTPVFLPGEFHGQRSLAGYSPCSCKDMTEGLSLSKGRYMKNNWT